ncbi:MAG: hypothetical protein ACTHKP_04885, partial [Nitrososphaeraceae archaeon]
TRYYKILFVYVYVDIVITCQTLKKKETNKKGEPQHNPSVNSCLVRIPGTINSKCGQEVKIVQRWDGQRPACNTVHVGRF